ncbi:class I adenylate-forming enzyme family protein [Chelativorans sp. AA-79]|uniref:class I adenylate-forming enzyme family protein n=1 Tax=Chelativorans sp. AA-79 TaxID=3028735 RepID=UPI0023F6DBF7|nr:class I adenylate-forming enzyme family protein [Chelativorans sp. AA-79]WEX10935.1 class I adenylate-forming enzyme family protein [Chelativorans sp. AA-79]
MNLAIAPNRDEDGRVIDGILAHAAERPDDIALICGDAQGSWRQLRTETLAMAGAIAATGSTGDRVVLLGDVSIGLVTAYLAVIAAGQCAVPLQTSAHPEALAGMIGNCAPGLIFADGKYLGALKPFISPEIVTVRPDREAGELNDFVAGSHPLPAPRQVPPENAFNIIYSSGTTGTAKGIVHSHAMRYRQASRGVFDLDPFSTMLLATPLYSNTTLMPLLMTLLHGGRVVMMQKFDAEGYLDLAEKYAATHTMLVPVQYQRILSADSFAGRNLTHFRVKQSTGAPLPATDKLRVAQEWPGRFIEVYGLTEGGCTCMLDVTAHPDKAHTVGKPAPGNEIRVVDEEGYDVPVGERGEVIGRSAMMMSGYFRNPAADEAFYWRNKDGVLYHRTGDIGVFDEDGFLTLVDRKKDVIISGGFNIYASDIEEKLREHPDIEDAVVIAIPNEKWGETPLGVVVARPGARIEPAQIREWVNARLGKMQRVSRIELRGELPRSAVGKVLKQELKKPYWGDASGPAD